jgi:hypothetical protein
MSKKDGCKPGEVKFKDQCWPKVLCEPKLKKQIDWKSYPDMWDEKTKIGCWICGGHFIGKCNIPTILSKKGSKFGLPKIINKHMQKKGTKTLTIADKEAYKIGNAKYSPGLLLKVLEEIDGKRYAAGKGWGAYPLKSKMGKKVSFIFWQGKSPDGPLIVEGNGGVYILAPRIDS